METSFMKNNDVTVSSSLLDSNPLLFVTNMIEPGESSIGKMCYKSMEPSCSMSTSEGHMFPVNVNDFSSEINQSFGIDSVNKITPLCNASTHEEMLHLISSSLPKTFTNLNFLKETSEQKDYNISPKKDSLNKVKIIHSHHDNKINKNVLQNSSDIILNDISCFQHETNAKSKLDVTQENIMDVDNNVISHKVLIPKLEFEGHQNSSSTDDSNISQSNHSSNVNHMESTIKLNGDFCDHCRKGFSDEVRNCDCLPQNSEKQICPNCKKTFLSTIALKKHMKTHNQEDFVCEICQKIFKKKKLLKKHSLIHENRRYECEKCGKIYVTKEGLQNHASIHVSEGSKYKCSDCGKDCRTKKYLRCHTSLKHPLDLKDVQYDCPECGKIFKWLQTLKHHRILKHNLHPERKFHFCSFCNKKFIDQKSLKVHLRAHDKLKLYHCEICGDSFKYKHSKDKHTKIVHSEKCEFQCSICGKLFKTNGYLENHIRGVHESTEPIHCRYCDKVFKTRKIMQNHVQVCHTKEREKKYKCDECERAFISPKDLKRHSKVHSGVRDHICSICNRAFARLDNLKAHQKIHSL